MTYPPISCVMATRGRPEMAARAMSMFAAQDYPGETELVVVDSGGEPLPADVKDPGTGIRLHYVRMGHDTPLGSALNTGFEEASCQLLHKWDDDDQYGTGFLERAVKEIVEEGMDCTAWVRLLVVTPDGVTRLSEKGLVGGGSIVVLRDAWEAAGRWPEIGARVDAGFLESFDHTEGPRRSLVTDSPTLYTAVRHHGNMWKTVKVWFEAGGAVDVDLDKILGMLPEWKGGRT